MSISYAVFCLIRRTPISTLFPYTTLFRSRNAPDPHAGSSTRSEPSAASACVCCETSSASLAMTLRASHGPSRPTSACSSAVVVIRSTSANRSEEHTSELQSHVNLVCRLLLDSAHTHLYTLSLHDALPI